MKTYQIDDLEKNWRRKPDKYKAIFPTTEKYMFFFALQTKKLAKMLIGTLSKQTQYVINSLAFYFQLSKFLYRWSFQKVAKIFGNHIYVFSTKFNNNNISWAIWWFYKILLSGTVYGFLKQCKELLTCTLLPLRHSTITDQGIETSGKNYVSLLDSRKIVSIRSNLFSQRYMRNFHITLIWCCSHFTMLNLLELKTSFLRVFKRLTLVPKENWGLGTQFLTLMSNLCGQR